VDFILLGIIHLREASANIRFKNHSVEVEKIINAYVNLSAQGIAGRGPLGKAGSYGIQEPEILAITEEIRGDVFLIVGLPLKETAELLGKCNIETSKIPEVKNLYHTLWGSEIWKGQTIMLPKDQIPPNYDFVPGAMQKIN
jgi:hypothetical protein